MSSLSNCFCLWVLKLKMSIITCCSFPFIPLLYLLLRAKVASLSPPALYNVGFQCLKIQIGPSLQGVTVWEGRGLFSVAIQELNFSLKMSSGMLLSSLEVGVHSFQHFPKLVLLTVVVTRVGISCLQFQQQFISLFI